MYKGDFGLECSVAADVLRVYPHLRKSVLRAYPYLKKHPRFSRYNEQKDINETHNQHSSDE